MSKHGGPREGSGRKAAWKHGETVTIRVPEALKDEVLSLARQLDEGLSPVLPAAVGREASAVQLARELLADHLEQVGRKGTVKRSVVRDALDLLDSVT